MTRNTRFAQAALALVWLLPVVLGCEQSPAAMTVVRGRICYRGEPLHGGTIVFTPDELRGGSGPLSRAEIQADGSYALQAGSQLGAVPGWHRVTILTVDAAIGPRSGQPPILPHSLLPEKYRDPELSGLTCEVKAGQENTINFNLE